MKTGLWIVFGIAIGSAIGAATDALALGAALALHSAPRSARRSIANADRRWTRRLGVAPDEHTAPRSCPPFWRPSRVRLCGALVAYVYQLIVLPEHRRRGHAKAALREVAAVAASQVHQRIELHVFAHNTVAQALYRSVGFELESLDMAMPLSPSDQRPVAAAPAAPP